MERLKRIADRAFTGAATILSRITYHAPNLSNILAFACIRRIKYFASKSPNEPRFAPLGEPRREHDQSQLRAKLIEHLRVRLHVANEKFRFKHAERTEVGSGFSKPVELIRPGAFRLQQHRLRVP